MGNYGEAKVSKSYPIITKREKKQSQPKKPSMQTPDRTDAESSDSDSGSDRDERREDGAYTEGKFERKLRQAEEKLRDQALKKIMERKNGPRITSSGLHELVETQRKKKTKAEKKHARRAEIRRKEAAVNQSLKAQADEGGDIFMIDVNPTKANREKLEAPSDEDEPEDTVLNESNANRAVRRRMNLIARQKSVIQATLNVADSSDEKAEEVQKLLDEWIVWFDAKSAARQQKSKDRKKKTTTRLRNRSDRLLESVQQKKGSRSAKPPRRPLLSRND